MAASSAPSLMQQRPHLALNRHTPADWLEMPSERVVSIEHPAVVKDIDKGLQSLGGEHHIKHVGYGKNHFPSTQLLF